jgi:hypothetical protein
LKAKTLKKPKKLTLLFSPTEEENRNLGQEQLVLFKPTLVFNTRRRIIIDKDSDKKGKL